MIKLTLEFWLRTSEVMIGDDKISLAKNIIDEIIKNLNCIAIPSFEDILEIVEVFENH